MPEPLIVPWHGRQLRVRHEDPHLWTLTPETPGDGSARDVGDDAAFTPCLEVVGIG